MSIGKQSRKHKGLTDAFLRTLDEEFEKQKLSLNYELESSVQDSNDSLSLSSTSLHEKISSLPSFYEVEKNSNLVPPVIPKWDVVIPKLDKLSKCKSNNIRKDKAFESENNDKSQRVLSLKR